MSLTSYRAAPPRDAFLQCYGCSPVILAICPSSQALPVFRADGAALPRDGCAFEFGTDLPEGWCAIGGLIDRIERGVSFQVWR